LRIETVIAAHLLDVKVGSGIRASILAATVHAALIRGLPPRRARGVEGIRGEVHNAGNDVAIHSSECIAHLRSMDRRTVTVALEAHEVTQWTWRHPGWSASKGIVASLMRQPSEGR